LSELDLEKANINTVIWATGYSFDFSMVKLPIFDSDGYPIQQRGITGYPGLYFVGLPWSHNAKSGLLFGVAQDAAHIASSINAGADPNRFAHTTAGEVSTTNLKPGETVLYAASGIGGIGTVPKMGLLVDESEQDSPTQEDMMGFPPSVRSRLRYYQH